MKQKPPEPKRVKLSLDIPKVADWGLKVFDDEIANEAVEELVLPRLNAVLYGTFARILEGKLSEDEEIIAAIHLQMQSLDNEFPGLGITSSKARTLVGVFFGLNHNLHLYVPLSNMKFQLQVSS